jgi:hypothetical protein
MLLCIFLYRNSIRQVTIEQKKRFSYKSGQNFHQIVACLVEYELNSPVLSRFGEN